MYFLLFIHLMDRFRDVSSKKIIIDVEKFAGATIYLYFHTQQSSNGVKLE